MLGIQNLFDIASGILGVIIFFITWHGSIPNRDNKIKVLGIAVLCTTVLDMTHLLSYTSLMLTPLAPPTHNWIAYGVIARLIWACALLYVIALPLNNKYYVNRTLLVTFLLFLIILITNISLNSYGWPQNLTDPFSYSLIKYILCAAILIDILTLIILRHHSTNYVSSNLLKIGLFFDIMTNFSYLIATHTPFDLNVPARLCKFLAYYYLLRAVFKYVIQYPYEQLLRLKVQLVELATANAKLYQDSEQQCNMLEDTLAKIGTIISSQLNLKDTLDAIVDMVADMMHARQSLLALSNNDQCHLHVLATYGINTPPTALPLLNSLGGQVLEQKKALIIGDISLHPEMFRPQLIFSSIRSIICAPLVNDGQITGIIEAYSSDIDAFSPRDALLLTAIAHHAGAAIASAMMYEETKLRLEEEKFLSEIAHASAATIDPNTIMEHCTSHTFEALNADIGLGLLGSNSEGKLVFITAVNFECTLTTIDLYHYPKLAEIIDTLKPAIATTDIFSPLAMSCDKNTPRYLMILPLAVNQRLLGVILLGWKRFTTVELLTNRISFAALMAQQIALGLEKAQLYIQVKSMALSDGLTGLANRRNFDMFLKTELRRAASLKRPLSLIMLDLDKFKIYNDTYGHPTGDKLLTQIGQILHNTVRSIDLPARYGGEEFSVILPECSGSEATAIAEKIRQIIEKEHFPDSIGTFNASITASLGVATYDPAMLITDPDMEKIIEVADKALYQAKQQGRNRIITSMVIT
ncbi:MAG TPA: diguanylate cyclase [Negativicutes bacterium]